MSKNLSFINELKHEAKTTRKMLERVPLDKGDWKPHEKSMSLKRLTSHVAELPGWASMTLDKDELDFAAGDYVPLQFETTEELLQKYDEIISKAVKSLENASDEHLMTNWKLKNGGQVYFDMPRIAVLRSMCFNHMVHHRGQLSVYLRLNDVPLPGVYGPTADEQVI